MFGSELIVGNLSSNEDGNKSLLWSLAASIVIVDGLLLFKDHWWIFADFTIRRLVLAKTNQIKIVGVGQVSLLHGTNSTQGIHVGFVF